MLTGCDPGNHGVFDFVRRVPGTYRLEFVNATHRRGANDPRDSIGSRSTRRLRRRSVHVAPRPLNGVVVAGFDSPVALSIDASFCEPKALWRELKAVLEAWRSRNPGKHASDQDGTTPP